MNGAEHYKKAEQLLESVKDQGLDALKEILSGGELVSVTVTQTLLDTMVRAAEVHATLALAAATALPALNQYMGDETTAPREWAAVL